MSLLYEVPRVDGDRPPTPLSSWARFRDAVLRLGRAAHAAVCRVLCRWV
jgi:hypothetical protein